MRTENTGVDIATNLFYRRVHLLMNCIECRHREQLARYT